MKKAIKKRFSHLIGSKVIPIRPRRETVALIDAAVSYCETTCGGCELTRKWRETRID